MVSRIILLTGAISSGKTTLAEGLNRKFGAGHFRTAELIAQRLRLPRDQQARKVLQDEGEALDRRTDGTWVVEALSPRLTELAESDVVVVDALRTRQQIESFRRAFGRRVVHVHLEAPLSVLSSRYGKRRAKDPALELPSYAAARASRTERRIGELAKDADIVIDTARCTREDVLVRAASHL